MAVFWDAVHVVRYDLTDVTEDLTASSLVIEAVRSSETSVNIYKITRCCISKNIIVAMRQLLTSDIITVIRP